MSLAAGTRLGPYEIIGPIGAGGMGEGNEVGRTTVVVNWMPEARRK
jgi:hypothetical protein